MITKLFMAILNAIIVFIVLSIIVAVLVMVGFTPAGVITPFIFPIAVIVGVLTFLGSIPLYWNGLK